MSKLQRLGVYGVRALGAGVALSVLAFAANCGGSTQDNPAPADTGGGGTDTAGGTDTSGGGDVKTEGGTDTAKGDSATPDFTANLIAEGAFDPIQATGMTTDDHFIAIDDKGNAVAIPVGGGAPITISDGALTANVVATGKTVLVWKSVNKTTSVGTLVVWTKATGAKTLSTTSILYEAAASEDGSLVVYADNARSAGKVFDYSISKTDGTGVQKAVITNVMEDPAKCAAQSGFAGNKAVLAWCEVPATGGDGGLDAALDVGADVGGDAGPPAAIPATISSIDASGTVTTLKTNAVPQYSESKDQTKITLLTQAGAYSVLTLGGAETPIATGVTFGGMFPEGNKVLYVDTAKDLYAATVGATPAPVKLASGVGIFYNPIPGATHIIYGTKQDSTGRLSDMFLAPVGGGTAITLSTAANATIFGDQWTADKSMVTIYSPAVGATGTLLAIDPAAPTPPKTIATNSWVAYSPKGSTIVYNDTYNDTGDTSGGSSDIHIVDAKTGGPKLIAVQAGSDFYLTTARDKVCFASVDPSLPKQGVYCTTLP